MGGWGQKNWSYIPPLGGVRDDAWMLSQHAGSMQIQCTVYSIRVLCLSYLSHIIIIHDCFI